MHRSVLSLHQLIEHADCVLPVENEALLDICAKAGIPTKDAVKGSSLADVPGSSSSGGGGSGGAGAGAGGRSEGGSGEGTAFDAMNNIAAHLLTNMTASMRFEGSLNVDLNEITTNLVPFPRMHFLSSSLSPLYSLADIKAQTAPRRFDQMFTDAFSR